MRAPQWSIENGALVVRSKVPTSDVHCFFGDDKTSLETLSAWENEIRKTIPRKTLKSHLSTIEKSTGVRTLS